MQRCQRGSQVLTDTAPAVKNGMIKHKAGTLGTVPMNGATAHPYAQRGMDAGISQQPFWFLRLIPSISPGFWRNKAPLLGWELSQQQKAQLPDFFYACDVVVSVILTK